MVSAPRAFQLSSVICFLCTFEHLLLNSLWSGGRHVTPPAVWTLVASLKCAWGRILLHCTLSNSTELLCNTCSVPSAKQLMLDHDILENMWCSLSVQAYEINCILRIEALWISSLSASVHLFDLCDAVLRVTNNWAPSGRLPCLENVYRSYNSRLWSSGCRKHTCGEGLHEGCCMVCTTAVISAALHLHLRVAWMHKPAPDYHLCFHFRSGPSWFYVCEKLCMCYAGAADRIVLRSLSIWRSVRAQGLTEYATQLLQTAVWGRGQTFRTVLTCRNFFCLGR